VVQSEKFSPKGAYGYSLKKQGEERSEDPAEKKVIIVGIARFRPLWKITDIAKKGLVRNPGFRKGKGLSGRCRLGGVSGGQEGADKKALGILPGDLKVARGGRHL